MKLYSDKILVQLLLVLTTLPSFVRAENAFSALGKAWRQIDFVTPYMSDPNVASIVDAILLFLILVFAVQRAFEAKGPQFKMVGWGLGFAMWIGSLVWLNSIGAHLLRMFWIVMVLCLLLMGFVYYLLHEVCFLSWFGWDTRAAQITAFALAVASIGPLFAHFMVQASISSGAGNAVQSVFSWLFLQNPEIWLWIAGIAILTSIGGISINKLRGRNRSVGGLAGSTSSRNRGTVRGSRDAISTLNNLEREEEGRFGRALRERQERKNFINHIGQKISSDMKQFMGIEGKAFETLEDLARYLGALLTENEGQATIPSLYKYVQKLEEQRDLWKKDYNTLQRNKLQISAESWLKNMVQAADRIEEKLKHVFQQLRLTMANNIPVLAKKIAEIHGAVVGEGELDDKIHTTLEDVENLRRQGIQIIQDIRATQTRQHGSEFPVANLYIRKLLLDTPMHQNGVIHIRDDIQNLVADCETAIHQLETTDNGLLAQAGEIRRLFAEIVQSLRDPNTYPKVITDPIRRAGPHIRDAIITNRGGRVEDERIGNLDEMDRAVHELEEARRKAQGEVNAVRKQHQAAEKIKELVAALERTAERETGGLVNLAKQHIELLQRAIYLMSYTDALVDILELFKSRIVDAGLLDNRSTISAKRMMNHIQKQVLDEIDQEVTSEQHRKAIVAQVQAAIDDLYNVTLQLGATVDIPTPTGGPVI